MTYVRTFAEEMIAIDHESGNLPRIRDAHHHMALCLAELVRRAGYSACCRRFTGEITLERLTVNPEGYNGASGRYYGTGANLYILTFDDVTDEDVKPAFPKRTWWDHTVRAADRPTLRAALRAIFPNARIGR